MADLSDKYSFPGKEVSKEEQEKRDREFQKYAERICRNVVEVDKRSRKSRLICSIDAA